MNEYNLKVGDKVYVDRIEFNDSEWIEVGKVEIDFKVGDILTIKKIDEKISALEFEEAITKNCWFPIIGFVPININKITKKTKVWKIQC